MFAPPIGFTGVAPGDPGDPGAAGGPGMGALGGSRRRFGQEKRRKLTEWERKGDGKKGKNDEESNHSELADNCF